MQDRILREHVCHLNRGPCFKNYLNTFFDIDGVKNFNKVMHHNTVHDRYIDPALK